MAKTRRNFRTARDSALGFFCLLTAFTSGCLLLNISMITSIKSSVDTGDELRDVTVAPVAAPRKSYVGMLRLMVYSDDSADPEYVSNNYSQPKLVVWAGKKTICSKNTDLFVYVPSKKENFIRRRLIRQTWGSLKIVNNISITVVFILGKPLDINDQVMINNEQLVHEDIIQVDVHEHLRNLSVKAVAAMSWIHERCKHIRYVMKVDDDIFVNVFELTRTILPQLRPDSFAIACHVVPEGRSPIVRSEKSRWYIPENLLPGRKYFPTFCSGYTVVMTAKTAQELFKNSLKQPILPVDDVYNFGILAENLNVTFMDVKGKMSLNEASAMKSYESGDVQTFAIDVKSSAKMELFWSLALQNEMKNAS
ncbi:beta-1,3-galactosyltransferase 1-like [Dreissena polymorpha]|uniref:Hexosyltransferase n=1 Tax=Dreissena polymorpha TaxID=45954 RepID=A0A9D4KGW5_DREPO|nr:beta-1,3-galactosyltransferase 1-like [Dreissena polymorpha]XP_052281665.1 beta-1,3-galactosyltransferase 1-like [Dreissena polymorpha]KAH3839677.1 hypothetical protein DPMN_113110 [Dreissena polymorpha]